MANKSAHCHGKVFPLNICFRIVVIASALLGLSIMKSTAWSRDDGEGTLLLRLVQTILLPGVKGRIDHMAIDSEGKRLFIAALGNNTLEIVDLREGKRIRTISGLREPQGVSFVAELGKIFVSNGMDGTVNMFDSTSYLLQGTVKFPADADNLRYDARSKNLYVGYGTGGLGIVNTASGKIVGDIGLRGHPESFQLESTGPRIFVNVPSERHVAVVDRDKRSIISSWPLRASGNFSIALDGKRHRLFIGCRNPAKILIYDTESGSEVSQVAIGADVDDIFYDEPRGRIYASCGEGVVDVIRQIDADHYEVMGKMKTVRGARTSLVLPREMLFYLAVPASEGRGAEIRVYTLSTK